MASTAPLLDAHGHKVKHVHHESLIDGELALWDKFESQDLPNFFSHLELASDGGFSEVKDMYTHSRWVSASVLLIFVVYNIEALCVLDIQLMGHGAADYITEMGGTPDLVLKSFYFSDGIVDWVYATATGKDEVNISPVCVLGALELLGLFLYITKIFYDLIWIKKDDGFRKWFAIQDIFWNVLPTISCYSAMKLLNNIVPTVAAARFGELLAEFQERRAEKKSLAPFAASFSFWIFMLIFGFLAGFDTFLMKLRIVAARANGAGGMIPCIQFLVQVLGVVQLGAFVRKRLFVFIFGGEDGVMQDEETELMNTWNAMLTRRAWRDLTPLQFFAFMLSFSDEDFQGLVLNENKEAKEAQLGS